MSVLRIFDPVECDEHGVPLDWERCLTCGQSGVESTHDGQTIGTCPTCGGYGSLKEAALAALMVKPGEATAVEIAEAAYNRTGHPQDGRRLAAAERRLRAVRWVREARCENPKCAHPMSEGTWEGTLQDGLFGEFLGEARNAISREREPFFWWRRPSPPPVHFSPCDDGCRHGGPARLHDHDRGVELLAADDPDLSHGVADLLQGFGTQSVEASWRPVEVRTLGWPHDLRPEKLAVLCLRCWAARSAS